MPARIAQLVKNNALHVRNVAYFLGTRAFAIIAFVLVVPFFIRHTSEEHYGLAAIAFSLLGIANVLDLAFGYVLMQSLGRRYARGRTLKNDSIHGLLSIYIWLSAAVVLCSLSILFAMSLTTAEYILYGSLALLLPALSVSGVVAAVFQAQNQLKPVNLSRFGFELAKVLAMVLSALAVGDITLIGPVLMLAAYVRAILDAGYLAKMTGIRLRLQSIEVARRCWRLARHGTAYFYVVALTALVTISDKLLIKQVLSAEAVAHYSVSFDINTKAYLLINAVNTAMFAVVLHRFAQRGSTRAPLTVGLITVTLVAVLYYLPLLVMAPKFLTYWLGVDFAESAAPLTRIMVLASLFYLYGNVFENALRAMGCARRVLNVYLIGISAYSTVVGLAVWHKSLLGFMYGYLTLCVVLFLGFIYQYRQVALPAGISGEPYASI
jgi:O-antigen/teichoic acid export membrane protein